MALKPGNLQLLSGWIEFLNDSIPTKYWWSQLTQDISVENRLNGLIKKKNGYDIPEHLKEIGLKKVSKLSESQIIAFLTTVNMSLNEKLNLLIGQVSHHVNSIESITDRALGSEWSLSNTKFVYTPMTYAFLLVCLEHDLLSSLKVSEEEIKAYHYRK